MPIKHLRPLTLNALGNGSVGPLNVPASALEGMQVWFQAVVLDIWATPVYSTTNMVQITVESPSAGTLVSWGWDGYGQVSNAPTGTDFVQVSAGYAHSVALKLDGTLVSWGEDSSNQVSHTPTDTDFVQVAAGDYHSLALKSDGTLMSWGDNVEDVVLDLSLIHI